MLHHSSSRASAPSKFLKYREFLDAMLEHQEPSWIAVEAVPTQARVLHALRGSAEACSALVRGRNRSALRGHLNNVCRLALIEAELSALSGDRMHAQELACEAAQLAGETPSIELIGLSERVKALIAIASGARPAARVHFGRSERLFMASGLRTEARRTRRLRIRASRGAISAEVGASKRGFASVVTLGEAHYLASLAPNPGLLATELIHTAGRLRLVDEARIVTATRV